jgi:hypothetical protein
MTLLHGHQAWFQGIDQGKTFRKAVPGVNTDRGSFSSWLLYGKIFRIDLDAFPYRGRYDAMFAHRHLSRLDTDAQVIERRLKARISPWELFALTLALSLLAAFVWTHSSLGILPNDFLTYLRTASGDFRGYYYAYWMLPVFSLLAQIPSLVAYAFWAAINIVCVFFAARVFGGRVPLALLSFQMLYVAFVGQIMGIITGGLALLWWGLHRRNWILAGFGLTIACTKFHIGIIGGAILLLMVDIPWRKRLQVLIIPAIVFAISLVIYPLWPLDVVNTIRTTPANDWGSIALWRWIGPYALLLWIPPLLLPLSRTQRIAALTVTMTLALPYFQQTDLLALFILPIGWIYVLLGNLGYLFFAVYWEGLQILVVVPLLVYATIIFPAFFRWLTSLRRHAAEHPD